MVTDRPTASLTGQGDWEWNRRRGNERASPGSTAERRTDGGADGRRDRETALEREIRELEAALERKDRRLQSAIDRYERLLAEKNRKLNDCRESDGAADDRLALLRVVSWRRNE